MSVLSIYKPIGKTPLDIINQLKTQETYQDTKMSYVGRLDPMAHGLQLIITDELCKNPKQYLNLDKNYEFSICFGIQTDTYDILGNIQKICLEHNIYGDNMLIISDILDKFVGKMTQEYPIYSSKRVNGNPLWYYAKNNIPVEIPSHQIEIYSLKYVDVVYTTFQNYILDIINKIEKLDSNYDFRQQQIIKNWKELLENNDRHQKLILLKLKARVSSGTYIRTLVKDICEYLGIVGMTANIYRTSVGNYQL